MDIVPELKARKQLYTGAMDSPFHSRFSLIIALTLGLASGCGGELVDPAPGGSGGSGGAGGSGSGAAGAGGTGGAPDTYPLLACDPIVPSHCGFPFPSNVYTVADATSATGRRVSFLPEGLPPRKDGSLITGEAWKKSDGFSSGGTILAQIVGATNSGLAQANSPEDSLAEASPTVLLDAETGQRVLHWAEIDKTAESPEQASLLIFPAEPLRDGARYIVAVRGLLDAEGTTLEASPAFAALRDGTASDDASVEARRDLYTELFGILERASVGQEDLQLAWDFTTASRASNSDWLLHMRDEAMPEDSDGPSYTITSVDQDLDPVNIAYRLRGTMTVPLYLTSPDPGGFLVFGEDGLPEPNADQPTADFEWELLIPQSALNEPAKLLQYGHGLLGEETQVESEHFRTFCNLNNYAIFSTKLSGMASEDEEFISLKIATGDLDQLTSMFDRLHQGFLNNLLVMRMVSRGLTQDPTYGSYLDGSKRFYWGISQGGISGGVLLSISPDVERGALEVMGQPYSQLLNRSVDFDPFFALMRFQYPDARRQQHVLGVLQMLWDRVEPAAYSKYAFSEPFAGSPANRRTLLRVAVGDHQVSTFGGQTMARAMGAKHLDTGVRNIYGLTQVLGPVDENGAVYAEWDFGLPAEPLCNLPLSVCDDPHGKLRKLEDARAQLHQFFDTGVIANTCTAGNCDHSDLSGCTGAEDPNPCDDAP